MPRLIWAQLRYRAGRTVALLLGILVATTAFSTLTASAQTSRLEVRGTVAKNFRSAYDILVRPKGSQTPLESRAGLVQQNYLSGIFGGITTQQYAAVRQVPGIEVAAPIAMIGYVLQTARVPIDLTAQLGAGDRQLFTYAATRTTDRGLSHFPGASSGYVYVTKQPLREPSPTSSGEIMGPREQLSSGRLVTVCPSSLPNTAAKGPFDPTVRRSIDCWSQANGLLGEGWHGLPKGHVAALLNVTFPFLIAAIDPEQEAKLAHLDAAVIGGRYLRGADQPSRVAAGGGGSGVQVPVLAASGPLVEDTDLVTVRRQDPARAAQMAAGLTPAQATALVAGGGGGVLVSHVQVGARAAYENLLASLRGTSHSFVDNYWTAGPTRYRQQGGSLQPVPVRNPAEVWRSQFMSTGYVIAPIDAADRGFRQITPHVGSNEGASLSLPVLHAVGTFDPARLPGFSALTQVPLGTYAPPQAAPADPRSRTLLAGRDLLPNSNFAGYLTPPPTLLTTLASVPIFEGSAFGGPKPAGPISVIRVRVAGVTGADAVSRERVRAAAQQIAKRTGLAVDVTLGSSPTPQRVELAAGKYGRPGLSLREGWVKKGVAVAILTAVDRKSLVLFVLILLVCALVVSNAASAAVRARRTELGMLACLGWSTRRLFTLMLGEVAVVGLVAGAAGSAVALPLAGALGLASSPARAVLAVPAAVLLSLLAGLTPAWRASRSHPADAVRPAVLSARRARDPKTMLGLAATNLLRVPGRSLLGALSLAVGVCALTLLLAVTISFRGVLVGSLLGEAVSVQIRGVDYLAVATIIALGGFAVADVLYLNVRERAVELATLQAMGWTDATLARLLTFEGAGMGLAGGLAGSVLGLSGAAIFGGALPSSLWLIAVLGTGAGTIIAVLSAVVPAQLLRRLPIAQLLAEE